jgi:hypothetical protein
VAFTGIKRKNTNVIVAIRLNASKWRKIKYPAWRKEPVETGRIVDPVEATMDPINSDCRFLAFNASTAGVLAERIIRYPRLKR